MISVSVIMPVYNVEKYLAYTVRSFINQTYKDWELLLIDDGSTDGSANICDHFAQIDNRIRVYHKENSGVSSARNTGIANSTGEYLVFADSDDLCHPLYLEKMINYIRGNDCDIVFSSPEIIDETSVEPIGKLSVSSVNLYSKNQNMQALPESFFHVVWGKIYKRGLIIRNRLHFDIKLSRGEDTLFAYQTALYADKIVFTNDTFVNYRQRCGSLMQNKRTDSDLFLQSLHKLSVVRTSGQGCGFDKQLFHKIELDACHGVLSEFVKCNLSYKIFRENLRTLKINGDALKILFVNRKYFTKRFQLFILLIISLKFSPLTCYLFFKLFDR